MAGNNTTMLSWKPRKKLGGKNAIKQVEGNNSTRTDAFPQSPRLFNNSQVFVPCSNLECMGLDPLLAKYLVSTEDGTFDDPQIRVVRNRATN